MDDQNRSGTDSATRNKGLQEEDKRLRDPDQRTPHRAVEQDSPEQERLTTPQEENDQAISQLENPPQTEGPRERNNDAV
jgi:hypothetical protein